MMSAVTDEGDALTGLRVAVLGPGGVGGLLAALLARAGAAVTCLASAGTAQQLRTASVRVESSCTPRKWPSSGCFWKKIAPDLPTVYCRRANESTVIG